MCIADCSLHVSANAQVLKSWNRIKARPCSCHYDGKRQTRITTQDEAGIHIYNTSFLQEKVINYSPQKYLWISTRDS